MSRTRGKREAGGGRQRGADPFEEERTPVKQRDASGGGWHSWGGGRKAAAVIGGVLAAIALLGALWWALFVRAPDVSGNSRPGVTNNPNLKPGEAEDGPEGLSGRKEDYFTFLLIGRDTAGGGNTDALILVSYDVPNGQVNMMSIPRDTAVNVPWSIKKINSVYNAKESSGGGMENLKKQVAYLTGVMPDFHVIIEWKAVGEVVKAVGGVEFDVPRNMNYDDPYQDLHIHLNKGMQHLNADQAMAMLRYRHDNDPKVGYNDTGRMETQREFLKAMAKQVLQLKNMTKIGEFINIFMDNVETDLKLNDLMWFASKALSVDLSAMQSSTLPYIDIGRYRGEYFFLPNGPEIVPLVNEQFNPYNRPISEDDLQLIVKNKDGSCYVTNGELLDARWAKPVSSSAGTAGGGVSTTDPTGVIADPNAPPPSDPVPPSNNDPAPPATDPEDPSGAGEPAPPPDEGTGEPAAPDPGQPGGNPPEEPDPGAADPGVTDPGTVDPGAAQPSETPGGEPAEEDPPPPEPAPEPDPVAPDEPVPPPDEGGTTV